MEFDYSAPAELFAAIHRSKRAAVTYHRFATAAEAIQFAIERLKPDLLQSSVIESSDRRLDARQIIELYQSSDFPLPRAFSVTG